MGGFEGSFLGDGTRISPEAVMECGVCWWVYDPQQGDDVWQIAPGIPFSELPAHWRCPNCDAAPHQFMVLSAGSDRQRPARAAGREEIDKQRDALANAYRAVADTMRPLPVYNAQLDVRVVGMRRCLHGLICVVTTPWSMNLLLLPHPGETGREGSSRELVFPSGSYSFIAGHLDDVGVIETCSLFSPMQDFDDPEVAARVAEHAIEALFEAPEAQAPGNRAMSRRQFLRPGVEG